MLTCHLPSRLKKWSFLLSLFILLSGLAMASSSFAACEYLSSDFSSAAGWTADQDTGHWTVSNGKLDIQNIGTVSTYAKTDFYPDNFFTADVEVSIVSSSNQTDRVGIRFRTSGDVLFGVQGSSGQITTNGVLCYYYPTAGLLKFKVYDMVAGEWVVPIAARSVSVRVGSIGLRMVADGVIFRLNGQDTDYKLNGNFSFPNVVDNLYLFAGGTGLHARFDNVCAAPYEVTDFQPGNAMPLPSGQEAAIITSPAVSPVTSIVPTSANPFGFGSAAAGGTTLSLTAGISGLSAPADLYVGIQIGAEIYLFDANNNLHPLSAGNLVKWRANTTGGFNNVRLLPDIDMSGLLGIPFNFYFFMTPAGRLDSFRLWVTQLVIAGSGGSGGSSTVTDHAMETEIKQNIDLIFGITSGFSGGLTELMTIFEDENVVTMTPVDSSGELDLMAVLRGSPLTMNVNFASGYRMQSGSTMGGSARIVITPNFSDTSFGASFTGTFNNVTKDGNPFANGQLSGSILLTEGAGDAATVSGQTNFNNLAVSGQPMSGSIGISGTLDNLDLGALLQLDMTKLLQTTGNIQLSLSNLVSGSYVINSGTIDIVSTQSGHANVATNLQTAAGPVTLNMTVTASTTSAVINTTGPGAAGPYTLSMNNVTLDQNICANYPTAGTISFVSSSTGKTGVVTFTGTCNGSYGYSER